LSPATHAIFTANVSFAAKENPEALAALPENRATADSSLNLPLFFESFSLQKERGVTSLLDAQSDNGFLRPINIPALGVFVEVELILLNRFMGLLRGFEG